MNIFDPHPRCMSPEECLYLDCWKLAGQVRGQAQKDYHYSLVTVPAGMPYRMTVFSSFWDYKSKTWAPTEKFGTEGYEYPDFNHFVSESLPASKILDKAKEWLEETYPNKETAYPFYWVTTDIGNFSVIPDGIASNPKDQLYVISMHGMLMA